MSPFNVDDLNLTIGLISLFYLEAIILFMAKEIHVRITADAVTIFTYLPRYLFIIWTAARDTIGTNPELPSTLTALPSCLLSI